MESTDELLNSSYDKNVKLEVLWWLQIFLDLGERYLISGQGLKRGAMLGRGAFGFVYRATVNLNGNPNSEVAVKMLEPIDPGSEARISTIQIYKVSIWFFFLGFGFLFLYVSKE